MPRPGPRPYECVRRAWHSDRHQPMRGSLIQEIFRVVNEVHSPATRKNKEWQEKLPCVVLKAEEIMYSKANSEADYMDPQTLWSRANDAIDTIIRRDDANESGDLLQPCIEAALNLGCIPRRASRSQRHINPECYLSSTSQDGAATSLKITNGNKIHLVSSACLFAPPPPHLNSPRSSSLQFVSWYPSLMASSTMNSDGPEAGPLTPDSSTEQKESSPGSNAKVILPAGHSLLPCQDRTLPMQTETSALPSVGRVYPLLYSGYRVSCQKTQDPTSTVVTAPTLCLPSSTEVETDLLQNFLGCNHTVYASERTTKLRKQFKHKLNTMRDLSLRLGLSASPTLVADSVWTNGLEDVGSSSSCDGCKFSDPPPGIERTIRSDNLASSVEDKGLDFNSKDVTDEPLDSCSGKWSSEGEGIRCIGISTRKRERSASSSFDDGCSPWNRKTLATQFLSGTNAPNS